MSKQSVLSGCHESIFYVFSSLSVDDCIIEEARTFERSWQLKGSSGGQARLLDQGVNRGEGWCQPHSG